LHERGAGNASGVRRAYALLLVAAAAGGCGGASRVAGGSEGFVAAPPSISQRGTETVRSGRLVMEMGEDYFRPTVVRAPGGSRLTLVIENVGDLPHAFGVDGDGQKLDVTVQSGRSATVHVRVPRAGRLLFFCKYHWSRGMAGYLEASGS
jgi:uncharacterized cupredoxin-like copper-binding protein